MILAFQNLVINALTTMLREAPPPRPVPPQRRSMDPLRTVECADGVTQPLADLHFASRILPRTSKPEHAGVPCPLLCDCCRASAPRYEFAMRRLQSINNDFTDSPHRSTFHQMVLAASQLEEQIPRFGDRLFYVGVPVDTHESIHSNKTTDFVTIVSYPFSNIPRVNPGSEYGRSFNRFSVPTPDPTITGSDAVNRGVMCNRRA